MAAKNIKKQQRKFSLNCDTNYDESNYFDLVDFTNTMNVHLSKISTSNLKNGKLPNVISFKWAIKEVSSPSRLNCGPIKRYGMILSSVTVSYTHLTLPTIYSV